MSVMYNFSSENQHNKIHQWLRSSLIIFQVCKHASKQGAALKGLELQQHDFLENVLHCSSTI